MRHEGSTYNVGMRMDFVLFEPIGNATHPFRVVAPAWILPVVQCNDRVDETGALLCTDISHIAADTITGSHLEKTMNGLLLSQ
jgi:hypothetical protein